MSKPRFVTAFTTGDPYILQFLIHDAHLLTPEDLAGKLATIGEMIKKEHERLLQFIAAKTAPMA